MKIVIDIPEEIYIHLSERYKYQSTDDIGLSEFDKVGVSIKNGTPLPKGHGRLVILSKDAIKREQTPLSFSCQNWISETSLSNATVATIEADKAESEEV